MSSPLKGSKLQMEAKVCYHNILNLPKGTNNEAAWTYQVIPNFLNLILTGENPWIILDDIIISELHHIWDYIYGRRVLFTIKK